MVRRQEEQKKRPPFGMPKGIVLLAMPEGWCHSVLTVEGGMLCGRLTDVPVNATPHDARTAAATMVTGLARGFHGTDVEVTWDPSPQEPHEPQSWTGEVILVAGSETALPDARG
jgi:hypothetical protein